MCYSAQIWADYKKFTRQFGAILSVGDFTRIFWERREGSSPKIPKAIEQAFAEPRDEFEAQVKQMIDEAREAELGRIEERVALQQGTIAEAETALQKRVTKKSQEVIRVAQNRSQRNAPRPRSSFGLNPPRTTTGSGLATTHW